MCDSKTLFNRSLQQRQNGV